MQFSRVMADSRARTVNRQRIEQNLHEIADEPVPETHLTEEVSRGEACF
jgi:hypothetical protein